MKWFSKIGAWKYLLLLAILVLLIYFFVLNASEYFPHAAQSGEALAFSLLRYGFSLATSLLHFTVGGLVWLYGSWSLEKRGITTCLALFCFSWALATALLPAADRDSTLPSLIAAFLTVIAMISLTLFLSLYPQNLLSLKNAPNPKRVVLFQIYHLFLCLCSIAVFIQGSNKFTFDTPVVLLLGISLFYILTPITCIFRMISIFLKRQGDAIHHALLAWGVIFSVGPVFCLYILPWLIERIAGTGGILDLDSQLIQVLFLPVTMILTYTSLRSQLLLDRSMRTMKWMLTWMSSMLSIATLAFLTLSFLQLAGGAGMIEAVIVLAFLVPAICWAMQELSQRLLHSQLAISQRLLIEIQETEVGLLALDEQGKQTTHLLERLHHQLELYHFSTALFWYDEEQTRLVLSPMTSEREVRASALLSFLEQLGILHTTGSRWLDLPVTFSRPMWLHEIWKVASGPQKFVVFPLRNQERLTAVAILGTQQAEIGPELDVAEVILHAWQLPLERIRKAEQASTHLDLWRELLQAFALPFPQVIGESTSQALEQRLSVIFRAQCTIRAKERAQSDTREKEEGIEPFELGLRAIPKSLKRAYFDEGGNSSRFPERAVALLELGDGEGVLEMVWPHPRRFTSAQRRLLEIVAKRVTFVLAQTQARYQLEQEIKKRKDVRKQIRTSMLAFVDHQLFVYTGEDSRLSLLRDLSSHKQKLARITSHIP